MAWNAPSENKSLRRPRGNPEQTMSKQIRSIRGMHDVLPDQSAHWARLESILATAARNYGYLEMRMPIVEQTALFARSIGAVTDIVEKEMYTFDDRNGDSLTLRPEGTAGCVRACLEHGLIHNQQRKLWYIGPMFRHERPQKGRYRQFHQFGVEAFGVQGPELDVELILMAARVWRELGLEQVRLEINTLGSSAARAAHREVLIDYLQANEAELDEDARRRLHSNPLRVLDSKNPAMQALIEAAPRLDDYLDDDSREDFERVKTLLKAAGVDFQVNPRLVRGLDYYNKTVFEWVTDALGAQGTICAGGRYDVLVEQLGGRSTPAAGFAMGLERLISLMDAPPDETTADLYLVVTGADPDGRALALAEQLRDRLPHARVQANLDGGSLKSQFKRADRSGARFALLLDPAQPDEIAVKPLRDEELSQQSYAVDDAIDWLQQH